jgi:hypothetical protein
MIKILFNVSLLNLTQDKFKIISIGETFFIFATQNCDEVGLFAVDLRLMIL